MDYKESIGNIRAELKTYIKDNHIKSLVMGISGGIDSTLCALLARPVCDELNIPLIGRSLPAISNSEGENSRANQIGNLFCTDFRETEIQNLFRDLARLVSEENHDDDVFLFGHREIPNGNIKARIRMIYLYDLANSNQGMVLSTDNYTEYLLGFWTLHGDVGDYGMIQNLWKTEVYEMTEWIQNHEFSPVSERGLAIKSCIDADATDGLGISNTDLDQIIPEWKGSSRDGYAEVDKKLQGFNILLKDAAKTPRVIKAMTELSESPVIKRYLRTEFKRKNPVNISRNRITE